MSSPNLYLKTITKIVILHYIVLHPLGHLRYRRWASKWAIGGSSQEGWLAILQVGFQHVFSNNQMIYQNCILMNVFDIKCFRRRALSVFTCFRLWGLICERGRRRWRRRDENLESQEGGEGEEDLFKIRNIEKSCRKRRRSRRRKRRRSCQVPVILQ